jgi:hypothetical protein
MLRMSGAKPPLPIHHNSVKTDKFAFEAGDHEFSKGLNARMTLSCILQAHIFIGESGRLELQ